MHATTMRSTRKYPANSFKVILLKKYFYFIFPTELKIFNLAIIKFRLSGGMHIRLLVYWFHFYKRKDRFKNDAYILENS